MDTRDTEKSFNDVFVRNIQKIEFEPGVNFLKQYIICISVHYVRASSTWFGEVDVYMPIREIQKVNRGLFEAESFYVDFLAEKHKISAGLHDTSIKCFNGTEYAFWTFGDNFGDFLIAKESVEDLKRQFVRRLDALYLKDSEKTVVNPQRKDVDNYIIYGSAYLLEGKDKNLIVRRYLFPAERQGEYGNYAMVELFYGGEYNLSAYKQNVRSIVRLSNGKEYSLLDIPEEIDKNADLQTLQTDYSDIIAKDLDMIEERYYVAKQKKTQEYSKSDVFDIKLNNKVRYSVSVDKNLVYNISSDGWYIQAKMYIPDALIKKTHINDYEISHVLLSDTYTSFNVYKDPFLLNGVKTRTARIYVIGDEKPETVEARYDKAIKVILNLLEKNLQQFYEER